MIAKMDLEVKMNQCPNCHLYVDENDICPGCGELSIYPGISRPILKVFPANDDLMDHIRSWEEDNADTLEST